MQLRSFLITLLLFSAVIIGVSNFMVDLSNKYSHDVEDLSSLSSVERIQNETKNLEQSLRNTQITGTFLDVPLTVLSGVYSIFKLILVSFIEIWDGFITNISQYLMLPTWFTSILMVIIVIIIIFEVISAVTKYKV